MNRTEDSRLYIDAGHTRIKVATFRSGEWEPVVVFSADDVNAFRDWAVSQHESEPKRELIIGSVLPGLNRDLLPAGCREMCRFVTVSDLPAGAIDYQTPESLGVDRYLSCLGAWSATGKQSVIVVDAGTACTIDWMEQAGRYRGGVILPGRAMAAQSLDSLFPGRVRPDASLPDTFPGQSTTDSIMWGTTGAWLGALDHFLQRYQHVAGEFRLCLTGGDAEWLSRRMPDPWQDRLVHLPWALFEGLRQHADGGATPMSASGHRT